MSRREVELSSGQFIGFKKLLLASGGKVRKWEKDEGQNFIYRLQTIDDADRLFNNLEKIKKAVVVGGSFIALEFLEILAVNKSETTLLTKEENFFGGMLEEQGTELMKKNMARYGIQVISDDRVDSIFSSDQGLAITTHQTANINCDAIAVGIGIERNMDFLKNSGVEVGNRGIRTNEFFETSQPQVYAAGDVAEYYDPPLGQYYLCVNWTTAFLQGKRVGLNMAGQKEPFSSLPFYSLTNLGFHLTCLGECRNNLESIVRYDNYKDLYERIFLKGDIITGAFLINRFKDKNAIAKLIETKTNIGSYRQKLSTFDFDINEIPVIK